VTDTLDEDETVQARLERIKRLWVELQRTKKASAENRALVTLIRREADAFRQAAKHVKA